MPQNTDTYDVLIAGGGPAGTSAAIHLAQNGARVLLLEKERFPRHKLCGEFISPECAEHFARLGVADTMNAAGGVALRETVFYGRGGRRVRVPSKWFGGAALGLSRAEMDAQLLARARAVGAEVWEGAQVTDLLRDTGGRVLGVEARTHAGARAARARVTLDATGRSRVLARRVATRKTPQRAPLVAFKAHLADTNCAPNTCEIYFYAGGYGGLSSVESGAANLCFIVTAAAAKGHSGNAERVMREILQANPRAANTLAQARAVTPWLAVALERFGRFSLAPAEGLLTLGDAAAFIDPFTGSGMLMALQSGALVAQVLAQDAAWPTLAAAYQTLHSQQFDRRLRVSSWLRRAAFAPAWTEAALWAAGLSERLRERLAQATRNG